VKVGDGSSMKCMIDEKDKWKAEPLILLKNSSVSLAPRA
jgi:hypothetical protein